MLLILSLEGIEERPPTLSLGQESKNDCFLNLHAVSGENDMDLRTTENTHGGIAASHLEFM